MSSVPSNESPDPRAEAAATAKLDSPLRVMFGLVVLWACLVLIFQAHRGSESYIRLEIDGPKLFGQEQSLSQALEPRQKLLMPYSLTLPGTSPLKALTRLTEYPGIDFKLQRDNLDWVNGKPQSIHFVNTRLFEVIHKLLDSPKLGFALQGRNLIIFRQELKTTVHPDRKKFGLEWRAELDLSRERLLIVPTGEIDLWLSVYLRDDLSEAPQKQQGRNVQVEVWKGTDPLTLSKAKLDDNGYAQLSLSTVENIAFAITRKTEPRPDKPGRYELRFNYQSFE